ncbi:MAG: cupin domain-containing protein [Chloroflexi bacterium]|nr:cupin domain-containing protein [Chloroflexota bacterium]
MTQGQQPRVLRPVELPAINRAKGVISQPLVLAERGSTSLTMGISTFEPGSVIPLHTHNVEKAITILEGEAVAIIDGQEHVVRPYDTTFVPPGVPHHFRNDSRTPMKFLWTYGGAHVTRTYVETGQTVEHLSAEDRRIAGADE